MRAWKRLGIGLLTITMLIGGGMASAQKEPAKEQAKEPDPFQNLGLSSDQRSKLDAAKKERISALGTSQQKVVEIQKKLVSLIFDKKASDKEIDQVANQLGAVEKEALLAQIKFHKTIRQVLNQEQLTTLSKGGK
jgi:Spy/CpxP family protein refolding chaperone